PDEPRQLLVTDVRVLILGREALVVLDLLAQLSDLRLGLEGVREPARDVAHRLERLGGPFLDRREDLDDAALHGVQRAARGLAEVGGQQDQGNGNEQPEDRSPAPYLLVVHETSVSKVLGSASAGLIPTSPIA